MGRPWQEPDGEWASSGRVDLASAIDTDGRRTQQRGDFSEVYGDWSVLREKVDVDTGARLGTAGRLRAGWTARWRRRCAAQNATRPA